MYDWIIVADIHRLNRELGETTDRRSRDQLEALLKKKQEALVSIMARNTQRAAR